MTTPSAFLFADAFLTVLVALANLKVGMAKGYFKDLGLDLNTLVVSYM
jgi:ABC-type nitrate/sulfonate/bicarbonate transport system substrate-binding protein